MERLYTHGYISDPKSQAKSVVLSEEGERRSRELFVKHFALTRWISRRRTFRTEMSAATEILVWDGWPTIRTNNLFFNRQSFEVLR
jgi:hypothetical protein